MLGFTLFWLRRSAYQGRRHQIILQAWLLRLSSCRHSSQPFTPVCATLVLHFATDDAEPFPSLLYRVFIILP